jgi:hypothetical protein
MAIVGVVAAAIILGLALGNSAPRSNGELPAASGGQPSGASAPPSTSSPLAAPTDETGPPIAAGSWERIDLSDMAPGTFSGTVANDVVEFKGTYVAVGRFYAECSSDIYETPPGCEAVIQTLPTTWSAMVWVSEDGRTWTQLPHRDAFERGWMRYAATDGERIVVTGVLDDRRGVRSPAVWVSNDGRDWQLIEGEEFVPEQIVATNEGFIGVRPTDESRSPQFVASEDGSSWRALTDPGDLGPGPVLGLAVGRDGVTVLAVGSTYEFPGNGESKITATNWFSRDQVTWERGPTNAGHVAAEMIAATETDAGWVAVGVGQGSAMAVWSSPEGLSWTRGEDVAAPYGGPDDVAWTGEQIVATGTVGGESSSVLAFWLSPDGSTWEIDVPDTANGAGTPERIVAFDDAVVTVGTRSTDPDHWIGVVWIAGR